VSTRCVHWAERKAPSGPKKRWPQSSSNGASFSLPFPRQKRLLLAQLDASWLQLHLATVAFGYSCSCETASWAFWTTFGQTNGRCSFVSSALCVQRAAAINAPAFLLRTPQAAKAEAVSPASWFSRRVAIWRRKIELSPCSLGALLRAAEWPPRSPTADRKAALGGPKYGEKGAQLPAWRRASSREGVG